MRKNAVNLMIVLLVAVFFGLTGCGGGSSSTPAAATATGKFIDAPVEGLKYVSGGQSGVTGPNGEFTYEVGQPVKFSVGGVVVGQAQGASVITPIELVKAANPSTTVTSSTPEVVQIAQFLLTSSSLTATGVKIDSTVITACASQNINLSTATTSDFNTMINQVAVTAGNRAVTSVTDAQAHISQSMSGLSSGTVVLPPVSVTGGGSSSSRSLVGSWYMPYPNAGLAKGPVVITFFDNSIFIMAHDGDSLADPSGQPGIERGTYTWDQTTGAFNANVIVDTNGQWGFSHPSPTNLKVSADGNSLLIEGTIAASKVTKSNSNPIIGSWYDSPGSVVITFIDDSNFLMAHDGDSFKNPGGQPGIERGTYTWNQTTGAFNVNLIVDTNGQWGFSPPAPTNAKVSADGNSLFFDKTGPNPWTRVQ